MLTSIWIVRHFGSNSFESLCVEESQSSFNLEKMRAFL